MLALVGGFRAIHIEVLGTIEADAGCAHGQHRLEVLGQLDVGLQDHGNAVLCPGRRPLELAELGEISPLLALQTLVILEGPGIGIQHHHTLAPVDDEHIVLAHIAARLVQGHDTRDPEAARQDRGVRGGPAVLGHEGRDPVVLHDHGVGRGQIVGDDDVSGEPAVGDLVAQGPLVLEDALDAVDHVVHVVLAGAEVGVVHLLEYRDQGVALQPQGPFGVATALADEARRLLAQRRVFQHQDVGIDEGRDVGGRAPRDVPADGAQLLARQHRGLVEAPHLVFHELPRDAVLADLELVPNQDMRLTDGDPPGDSGPVERDAHSPSPKRSQIKDSSRRTASCSSLPLAEMAISLPRWAASIMTPMMLLPLTSRPSRATVI